MTVGLAFIIGVALSSCYIWNNWLNDKTASLLSMTLEGSYLLVLGMKKWEAEKGKKVMNPDEKAE